ncbi:MAG TPA: HRDC domain-containing protein, partial [Archangium sp.]
HDVQLPAASAAAKKPRGFQKKRKGRRASRREPRRPAVELPETGASAALVERLRSWRLQEAKRRRVPAFRVLTNRGLVAVAQKRPTNVRELEGLEGIGPKVIKDSGAQIVSLCK